MDRGPKVSALLVSVHTMTTKTSGGGHPAAPAPGPAPGPVPGPALAPVLDPRALNRATLARQLLLRRSAGRSATDAVRHLVGLQAQNVKPPYYALAARLEGFRPEELSTAMEDRAVVRIVTLRSTIHTHTADDALTLRPLVQEPATGS